MKHRYMLLFCLAAYSAFSQQVWNHRLPLNMLSANPHMLGVSIQNDRILLISRQKISEVTETGDISGATMLPNNQQYANFISRRVEPGTGKLRLLIGSRALPANTGYTLRAFQPGTGITAEIALADSLGGFQEMAPAVLEPDENTLLIFGSKKVHKVHWDGNNFSLLWQKPLNIPGSGPNEVVRVNQEYRYVSSQGTVAGINSEGERTFFKNHPLSFLAAAPLPDGLMVCGATPAQKAMVAKLDFDGNLLWTKTFDDLLFNDILADDDDNLLVTGTSADNHILLQKMDGQGNVLWRKTYEPGVGLQVCAHTRGGYFIAAMTDAQRNVQGIRVDAQGETSPSSTQYFVQNRRLATAGVAATLDPSGALFFDGSNGTLVTPPDGETATIFSFAPWLGGKDPSGFIHLMANEYSSASFNDLQTGVVNGQPGDFNRVWRADKNSIEALRRDFLTDHALNDPIPYDLLTWPARGNVYNQYNIDFTRINTDPLLQSAPFVDVNGDGKYNVYTGDYPLIKGDQMVWWMMNDDMVHANTNGVPLKVDLGISVYAYDCPQNEGVKNSLFASFDIVNRAATTYDSTYIGFFTDFDLGCAEDDYLGCMPDVNSFYVYNQDSNDSNCAGGTTGFGDVIPVQTITFQDHALDHFTYFNNSPVSDSNPCQWFPVSPMHYYNNLEGLFSSGLRPTWGGSGYNPGSTKYTDHLFPSNPSDPEGWSMCTESLPPTDRLTVSSHGPFTLAPGELFSFTVTLTTHQNIPHPCPDIFSTVKPTVVEITGWHESGVLDQTLNLGNVQHIQTGQSITLGSALPGATYQWSNGASTPSISVMQPGEYIVTITTEAGCQKVENVLVQNQSGTGEPTPAPDWQLYPNPTTDAVHIVCPDCSTSWTLQVDVYNALGQQVLLQTTVDPTTPLSLGQLPSGLYRIALWQGDRYLGGRSCVKSSK